MFGVFKVNAQQLPPDQKYEYILDISGATSKADIADLESNMLAKPGVSFFESDVNHKYFTMRTSVPLTLEQCETWVNNGRFSLIEFAVDIKQKENLLRRKR